MARSAYDEEPTPFEELTERLRIDNLKAYVGLKMQEAFDALIAAQDDLIMNGTNGASDESLKLLGFKRTNL